MELKGKKINFLGDSITEGALASSPENIYYNVIKANEGLSEARGYGVGGSRIARQTKKTHPYDDKSFVERFFQMDDDADIVFVFGGTNDFGHGDAPIGEFTDRTPDTFYGACHLLMEGLMNKYPEATIVFATPLKRDFPRHPDRLHPSKLELDLIVIANIIIEVARYYSIPVLDLYSLSGLQPELEAHKKAYCPDGLHPNDAGHKILASRISGFLKSL